jgi:very-short-patch-repair endonuclease
MGRFAWGTMRTEVDIRRWLEPLNRGRAACVFSDDVADALVVLQQAVASESPAPRAVSLTWREVPLLANELNLLVAALAKATPDFFPALYGLHQAERQAPWSATQIESEAHAVTRAVPGVEGGACRRILEACYRRAVPSLGKLNRAEQARQFALAIDPNHLFVFIAVVNVPAAGQALRSLAQGAEWLASNVRSRVILVLPDELAGRHELDHVSYGACRFTPESELVRVEDLDAPKRACLNETEVGRAELGDAHQPVPPTISVSPLRGRPATNSEAEQALSAALGQEEELGALFDFNQQVATVAGQTPRVDLVWTAGKLVIEVDGREHRGQKAFGRDRMRDYELWLTGYSVIRFMDSDVLFRTDWVMDRIRAAVRYLRDREQP